MTPQHSAAADECVSDAAPEPKFRRIPNDVIGRLKSARLPKKGRDGDHVRAGAHALWLIAYRLEYGETFSTWETQARKHAQERGVVFGGRRWDQSIALLSALGLLNRKRGGRKKLGSGFAGARPREKLGRMNRAKFTDVPEAAFAAGPLVFALVATIQNAPFPQTFEQVCHQWRIKSPKTMLGLLKTIRDLDVVQVLESGRGVSVVVGRRGLDLSNFAGKKVVRQTGKNVAVQTGKNVVSQISKNVATYSTTKPTSQKDGTSHRERSKNTKSKDEVLVGAVLVTENYGTAPDGARRSAQFQVTATKRGGFQGIVQTIKEAADGRVNPKLVNSAGLDDFRTMVAAYQDRTGCSLDDAIEDTVQLIHERVGLKGRGSQGVWLNSWDLIRKSLMHRPAESPVVDHARTERMRRAITAKDPHGILADHLKTPEGLQPLLGYLDLWGEFCIGLVFDIVQKIVSEAGESGLAKVRSKIATWNYFTENRNCAVGDGAFQREQFFHSERFIPTTFASYRACPLTEIPFGDYACSGELPGVTAAPDPGPATEVDDGGKPNVESTIPTRPEQNDTVTTRAAPVNRPNTAKAPYVRMHFADSKFGQECYAQNEEDKRWRAEERQRREKERDLQRAAKHGFSEPMTRDEESAYLANLKENQLGFKLRRPRRAAA